MLAAAKVLVDGCCAAAQYCNGEQYDCLGFEKKTTALNNDDTSGVDHTGASRIISSTFYS